MGSGEGLWPAQHVQTSSASYRQHPNADLPQYLPFLLAWGTSLSQSFIRPACMSVLLLKVGQRRPHNFKCGSINGQRIFVLLGAVMLLGAGRPQSSHPSKRSKTCAGKNIPAGQGCGPKQQGERGSSQSCWWSVHAGGSTNHSQRNLVPFRRQDGARQQVRGLTPVVIHITCSFTA